MRRAPCAARPTFMKSTPGLVFLSSRGILDKPMIIKDLAKEMRTQGVDIFPDYDSHCYIEGEDI